MHHRPKTWTDVQLVRIFGGIPGVGLVVGDTSAIVVIHGAGDEPVAGHDTGIVDAVAALIEAPPAQTVVSVPAGMLRRWCGGLPKCGFCGDHGVRVCGCGARKGCRRCGGAGWSDHADPRWALPDFPDSAHRGSIAGRVYDLALVHCVLLEARGTVVVELVEGVGDKQLVVRLRWRGATAIVAGLGDKRRGEDQHGRTHDLMQWLHGARIKRTWVTTGDVRRWRQLRQEGHTFDEISQLVGRQRSTVYRHIYDEPRGMDRVGDQK